MRVLLVNKFLYPNGGSETYIFKLRDALVSMGHEVEFFGMEDERNIVGNSLNAHTPNMDFRTTKGGIFTKLSYARQIIYSKPARLEIRRVLDAFHPDLVILNNINFQITPSVIYEIKRDNIPVFWTTHDYQLVCPNHMFYIPHEKRVCELCAGGRYMNCFKNRCLHGSRAKSFLAAYEAIYYKNRHTYRMVDKFICPSRFLEEKLSHNPDIAGRTLTMHNFIERAENTSYKKGEYVLYFGRFDKEKGIGTVVKAAKLLPDVQFIFAGKGEMDVLFSGVDNIKNVGFVSGEQLDKLIGEALVSVYASEWYENCPFSVMESQQHLTPVIGANIGGIPELIRNGETGLLFKSGDAQDLANKIRTLFDDRALLEKMSDNCNALSFDTPVEYAKKLLDMVK